nr:proto-oncogene tyrosine-protein kinase ROS-like isoform X2 [Cherax quadricarinatus]
MTSQVFLLHDGHKDLQLLSMRLSVNTLQNVFSEERSSDCNCMTTPRLGGGIALDTLNTSDLSLYFVASQPPLEPLKTTTVYKTDLSGCFCEAIFVPEDYGYDAECLVTSNYTEAPTNAGTTETVIAIQLTAPEAKTDNCRLIIPPPVTYIGYYAPVTHNESVSCFTDITHCQYMKSMRNVIRVTGLQPYTQYVFRGAIETIYNKRMGIKSVAGPAAIFKTKTKAPEGVDKVTAEALSPEEIKVTFNVSEGQMCEVYWQRADTNLGPIHPTVNSMQEISVRINRLLPNTKYEVWVRVYSQDRLVHTKVHE